MTFSSTAEQLRLHLASGPYAVRQLVEMTGLSQPTLSRALRELGDEVLALRQGRVIHYLLRDRQRGLPEFPVYRVDGEGRLYLLGQLLPVRPEGFVMRQEDGRLLHSDGLPWWLVDMRAQGFLGRAFAQSHAALLGLSPRLDEWSDSDHLRALLAWGAEAVGNLLLGERAREQFLTAPPPQPLPADCAAAYARLAQAAAAGEAPGSSAGGEQPKFTACVSTGDGPCHVLVKFSETTAGPVSERWRDLLLAEHLALSTLREAGIPAAASRVIDHDGQRFLEVERFDRLGLLGRRAVWSLTALDAEFVGHGRPDWPGISRRLAELGEVVPEAAPAAALLWAFGTLIGNTDMHNGNLSFTSDAGRPYALAPAYDMLPMAFRPTSGGGLPESVPEVGLHPGVAADLWRRALTLAEVFLGHLQATPEAFSPRFAPCVAGLDAHVAKMRERIGRLG